MKVVSWLKAEGLERTTMDVLERYASKFAASSSMVCEMVVRANIEKDGIRFVSYQTCSFAGITNRCKRGQLVLWAKFKILA
ncbi:hypothetical protein TNIN_475731 [Trichonephila inaurata madagascariensis]|uniref:Uncharacterized protein n=1 Tax=Trichonephila inaurata madagascariensis TaxID=2747483 RepID=A0A8X6IW29_9ARAC|nr:hypothetical protein TNIN_475731 [Trichonephila inaurata madagascariensis]